MADPHIHCPAMPDDMPSLDPADRPLVITHADCPDGWCCGWLFRRHFGDNADYMQAKHGDPVPVEAARFRPRVFVADFSWKRDGMERLAAACGGRLTVIDHHRTAESELVGLPVWADSHTTSWPEVVFDLNHSGAHLTWQFLKSAGATDPVFADGNPPMIVQLVGDRDLWKWELPDSRELNAALSSYPKTREAWDDLYERLLSAGSDSYWRLEREGAAILRRQGQEVDAAVSRAVETTIGGHRVLVVNTTCHHSEIGGRLAAGRPFGATYMDDLKRNLRIWSFRSREGGIDVSEVAKRFGGGGHCAAAGSQRPLGEPMSALGWFVRLNPREQQYFKVPDSADGVYIADGNKFMARVYVTPDRLTEEFCRPLLAAKFLAGDYWDLSQPVLSPQFTTKIQVADQPGADGVFQHTQTVCGQPLPKLPPLIVA